MKKLIIAALLVVSISAFAQDENQPERKPRGEGQQRERMSPEQRNKALLDRMTTELKLDAKQQELIKPILAEQSARNQALRAERMAGGEKLKDMSSQEREALKTKREAEKTATESKLKAILTPEQFTKMKANEEVARERMREGRENRQNRQE
ncbi:hypothetical protein [Flavobacterium eburneipallidum]|uniref:hypothetical protein n=1 Tax=Flavobacterium eburneipallidum TaxID=3003263 RepID=UPI0022AC8683|nr:hypothetical protein [Flavobacterium eburneipallidum]